MRKTDVLLTPMHQRGKPIRKATAKAQSQDAAGKVDYDKLAEKIAARIHAKMTKPTKAQAREVLNALRAKYGVCDGGARFKAQHPDLAALLGWTD